MGSADLPPGDAGGRRVLVVEDEVPLARLVADYLIRAGFEATVVGNGTVAVEAARTVDPDVVVLDLGLPGLDGIAVCQALREFSDCYVLMLTARSEETDKLRGLAAGADDYLTKPFSPRELVARVTARLRTRPGAADGGPPGVALRYGPITIDEDSHTDTTRSQNTSQRQPAASPNTASASSIWEARRTQSRA